MSPEITSEQYFVDAKSYLVRGRSQLQSGTRAGLFYAAFELRAGTQRRLQEYLEIQKDISEKVKRGWEIPKLAMGLEKAFKSGEKIIQLTASEPGSGKSLGSYRYTPVTGRLQTMAGRLGEYLHAMKGHRTPNDAWWLETRNFLDSVLNELEFAASGELLGAPILNTKTKELKLSIRLDNQDPRIEFLKRFVEVGLKVNLSVQYLDRDPR